MNLKSIFNYNDSNQEAALSKIPLEKIYRKTYESMENNKDLGFDEAITIQLLDWFKKDFFQWINEPKCCKCGKETHGTGGGLPTPEEIRWMGNRVEL